MNAVGQRISNCPSDARVMVCHVDGGMTAARRLADMGIFPGAMVEVLRNEGGPVLIRVGGTRLALGRGMAEKVAVE